MNHLPLYLQPVHMKISSFDCFTIIQVTPEKPSKETCNNARETVQAWVNDFAFADLSDVPVVKRLCKDMVHASLGTSKRKVSAHLLKMSSTVKLSLIPALFTG